MDGKDDQRGSIEKDENRHVTSQLQLIGGKIDGQPRTNWITDLTNSTGAKHYQLKIAAEDRKRRNGLVVNLAQEMTLW